MNINEYSYKELFENWKKDDTQTNRLALLEWFYKFDNYRDWDGESFELEDGYRIYPIYQKNDKEEFAIIDAQIK